MELDFVAMTLVVRLGNYMLGSLLCWGLIIFCGSCYN